MLRIYHDDVWTCRRYLDCVLHSRCFLQIHKDYDACAPYPGLPNYQVPAVKYEVEIQTETVWLWAHTAKVILSWDYPFYLLIKTWWREYDKDTGM